MYFKKRGKKEVWIGKREGRKKGEMERRERKPINY